MKGKNVSEVTHDRRRAAVGARLLLGLATAATVLVGAISPAQAAPGNLPAFNDGVINVYKRANPGGTLNGGTGVEEPGAVQGKALEGVSFTLYKVNDVDPTQPEGWEAIQQVTSETAIIAPVLDNNEAPTTTTIGQDTVGVTQVGQEVTAAGTGLASFTGLAQGLYIVVEGDAGQNLIVSKAAPYYVALPISGENGTWLRTVNTFPKNTVSEAPTKSVVADTLNDGQSATDGLLTWTVTQNLPVFDAANPLTAVRFVDDLSNAGVTTNTVASLQVRVGGTQLTNQTHYTAELQGTTLTVSLTDAGLAQLTSGAVLTATYTTQGNPGANSNTVESFINNVSTGTQGSAQTPLGQITVQKRDAANQAGLSGAQFKLCEVAVGGGNDTAACDPIATGTTADPEGNLVFSNLRVGQYVLVETQAPTGYVLPLNPVTPVTVTDGDSVVTQAIANTKNPLPLLPLTGASGQLMTMGVGIGLLVLAGALMVWARSRRNRVAAEAGQVA